MSEIQAVLNSAIDSLSELPDPDLLDLVNLLERSLVHALIEQNLRGASLPR